MKVATAKVSYGPLEVLTLAILCNVMVCLAVWLAFCGKSLVDKMVAIVLPIALFVSTGFEHSVANMFMIPMGLMLKYASPDKYPPTEFPGVEHLTFGSFLFNNLAEVTLGNMIGGMLVGVLMWVWHSDRFENKTKSSGGSHALVPGATPGVAPRAGQGMAPAAPQGVAPGSAQGPSTGVLPGIVPGVPANHRGRVNR